MSEVVLYATSGALRGGGSDFGAIVPGVTTLDDIGASDAMDKVGNWRRDGSYVIQRGDLVNDRPYMGYVLQNGETGLPAYMQRYNEENRRIKQILRDHIRVGQTGGEALQLLASALEEAGFIYTDYQEYNKYVDEPLKDSGAPRHARRGQGNSRAQNLSHGSQVALEHQYAPVPHVRRRIHVLRAGTRMEPGEQLHRAIRIRILP